MIGTRADGFRYREYAPTNDERVWMSAGYAFAAVVARAFANYAWPADVRGVETDRIGGGLVTDLPMEPFSTDPDHVWVRDPVEIVLTDRQERSLVDAGLMPLSALPYSEEAGVRRGAQPAGAAALPGSDRQRGRCQCAAFDADQLDAVRLALRASSEDHGPRTWSARSRPRARSSASCRPG